MTLVEFNYRQQAAEMSSAIAPPQSRTRTRTITPIPTAPQWPITTAAHSKQCEKIIASSRHK